MSIGHSQRMGYKQELHREQVYKGRVQRRRKGKGVCAEEDRELHHLRGQFGKEAKKKEKEKGDDSV